MQKQEGRNREGETKKRKKQREKEKKKEKKKRETAIPSGMLCMAIANARLIPKLFPLLVER